MTSFKSAAAVGIAWLISTVCANYELRVWNVASDTDVPQRVWYGDGQAYVGPTVPSGIKVAVNFTVRDDRSQLLYTEVDHASSPPNSADFPEPTFLYINSAANASDPVAFAHSAVPFTSDDIFFFQGEEGFQFPMTWAGMAPGQPYIVPTAAAGTYSLHWIVDAGTAAALKAAQVQLGTR